MVILYEIETDDRGYVCSSSLPSVKVRGTDPVPTLTAWKAEVLRVLACRSVLPDEIRFYPYPGPAPETEPKRKARRKKVAR